MTADYRFDRRRFLKTAGVAVVGAVEGHEGGPAGELAGRGQGPDVRLGARVAEADAVDRRETLADQPGQFGCCLHTESRQDQNIGFLQSFLDTLRFDCIQNALDPGTFFDIGTANP